MPSLGTSWAFPWAWTCSQVCRGPEARKRSRKPRPAPVSRPGAWLESSESDPRTEAVKAGWPMERDKTLSRSCLVQKSKNFVPRVSNTLFEAEWLTIITNNAGHRPGRDSRPPGHCPSRRQFTRREHSRTGGDTSRLEMGSSGRASLTRLASALNPAFKISGSRRTLRKGHGMDSKILGLGKEPQRPTPSHPFQGLKARPPEPGSIAKRSLESNTLRELQSHGAISGR